MSGPSFEQGSPSPEHGMGGRLRVGFGEEGMAIAVATMARTNVKSVEVCIVGRFKSVVEASKKRCQR